MTTGLSLYRAILREIRARSPARHMFFASMYSKETVHASMFFMPSLEQMHSQASQVQVLFDMLPPRINSVAKAWATSNSEVLSIMESETEFGFQQGHLQALARHFFKYDKNETKPHVLHVSQNEGFEALWLLTCSKEQRRWAFRYSSEAAASTSTAASFHKLCAGLPGTTRQRVGFPLKIFD